MEYSTDLIKGFFGDAGLLLAVLAIIFFTIVTGFGKIYEVYRGMTSAKHELEVKKLVLEIQKLQAETATIIKDNELAELALFDPTSLYEKRFDKRPTQQRIADALIAQGNMGIFLLQCLISIISIIGGAALGVAIGIFFLMGIDETESRTMTTALFLLSIFGITFLYQGIYSFGQHLWHESTIRYGTCILVAILGVGMTYISWIFYFTEATKDAGAL
jgi:hypothetical protein